MSTPAWSMAVGDGALATDRGCALLSGRNRLSREVPVERVVAAADRPAGSGGIGLADFSRTTAMEADFKATG